LILKGEIQMDKLSVKCKSYQYFRWQQKTCNYSDI